MRSGRRRRERSDERPWHAEAAGRLSSLAIQCFCIAVRHRCVLKLTVKGKMRNEATVLGYDGQCSLGTKQERTFIRGYEETTPDKNGEVRKILTTHAYPRQIRELIVNGG